MPHSVSGRLSSLRGAKHCSIFGRELRPMEVKSLVQGLVANQGTDPECQTQVCDHRAILPFFNFMPGPEKPG